MITISLAVLVMAPTAIAAAEKDTIMNDNWTTYDHAPASGGKPKSMVVLLHGLGSNGQDLISLVDH